MYRLVAIDLDGTLLNRDKKISDENIEVINKAMRKGVKVVVCSGRIFAGARVFAKEIGTNEPLIACNGALIKDIETNEVLYSNTLSHENSLKIVELCKKENIYFHVYMGDTMYTEKLDFSSLFYFKKNDELPEKDKVDIQVIENIKSVFKLNGEGAAKIVIISNDFEHLKSVRNKVADIPNIFVTSSGINNFEVMNKGVDKGVALEILARKLGIKSEHVLAIGDNENDIEMLEFAGFGVAMGNGEEYIKKMADYVTLSNDDHGVAVAIKKFVL